MLNASGAYFYSVFIKWEGGWNLILYKKIYIMRCCQYKVTFPRTHCFNYQNSTTYSYPNMYWVGDEISFGTNRVLFVFLCKHIQIYSLRAYSAERIVLNQHLTNKSLFTNSMGTSFYDLCANYWNARWIYAKHWIHINIPKHNSFYAKI